MNHCMPRPTCYVKKMKKAHVNMFSDTRFLVVLLTHIVTILKNNLYVVMHQGMRSPIYYIFNYLKKTLCSS